MTPSLRCSGAMPCSNRSRIFAHVDQYDAHLLLTATIAFYGQIYFDFAGYSSLAIGTARLFGYRFPPNFNYP